MSYVSWINMHGIRRWPRVLSATFVIFCGKNEKQKTNEHVKIIFRLIKGTP